MRRWIAIAAIVAASGAGAFGLAVLAAEWRQDSPAIAPLIEEIEALRTEVAGLQSGDGTPEASPTPEPSPSPIPEPVVIEPVAGASVELRGTLATVEAFGVNRHSGSMTLALENITTEPMEVDTTAFDFSAINFRNFVCRVRFDEEAAPVVLAPGEKTDFWVSWGCPNSPPKSLTIDHVTFPLPTVPRGSRD